MFTDFITSQANRLIHKYGTRDPYRLCEALGIRVRMLDLQRKIRGYYFYQSRIETIVIDEDMPELFRRILVAHELGHAVLHREAAMLKGFAEPDFPLACDKNDICERDANLFAAELLLDDAEVLDCLSEHTFFETAAELNVPAALLDYKFYIMQKKGYALSDMALARPDFLKN